MDNQNFGIGILGIGMCLPESILTNYDLEKMVDTSDEWIIKRTGISERRILDKDEPAYKLGVKAAQRAIEDAGLKPEEIDFIIVTTTSPDYLTPSMSCMIQSEIGAVNAAALDINAACTGFIYALKIAEALIANGCYKNILLVACEGLSKVVDWEDRATCVLFGDGAGAVVIGAVENGLGIVKTCVGADGSIGHNLTIPCCYLSNVDLEKRVHENKRVVWMDGSEVFKFAVKAMAEAASKVLDESNFSIEDIKLIIPHQANVRIIDGAAKRLGVSLDKMYINLNKYGNISSASIPVALKEAVDLNLIKKGELVLLVGFGGGLTWGSTVMRWNR
ncbi:MAG TPA: ketoacyl-ACP synthase III [Clostridiaceae bacterium]|nr:ketoacyl-ACP synthase III [Clostridiaceae bacterium]